MLRRVLVQSRAQGASLAAIAGGDAPVWTRQVCGSATRCLAADATLSSGHAASHSPPDSLPGEDFNKSADMYLRGLWSKVEKMAEGLDQSEGLGKGLDVQLEGSEMKLSLPEGGRITITKDPEGQSLVVHSNLHDFYGSDGTDVEVPFRLQRDMTWETDGEELHEFLEDGIAKHLKVQVDLEPDPQTLYGPDPT